MSDYIPTTDEVRDGYYSPRESYEPDHNAEFDRWLAQHDSEIMAKAGKRIIKLLEELDRHGSTHSEFCAARHAYAKKAIALIKGSNE